jgi:inner membrane protein involved in colicin E2 resistance
LEKISTDNKKMLKIPMRYLPKSLSKKDKILQMKELKRSRKQYKNQVYHTRTTVKSFHSKPSHHITNAQKIYKIDRISPSSELAKKTGCSIGSLQQIVKKGQGAYFSSGSRPNQTSQSWGSARLASAITAGKAAAVDYHILEKGCKSNSKALRLARTDKRKYGFGQGKTKKIVIQSNR